MQDERDARSDPVETRAFTYERFDSRHADLFDRAWRTQIARGEGLTLGIERMRRLYESSPWGPSEVCVASVGEHWIGLVSGIAMDVVHPDGRRERVLQIGDFMVDESWQRRGIGSQMLEVLVAHLRALGRPICTFPNRRSVDVFLRQGFEELRALDAILLLPSLAGIAERRLARDGEMSRSVDLTDAAAVAEALSKTPRERPVLCKDAAYLSWRYGEIRDPRSFRFRIIERPGEGPVALVVTSGYRFRGISFVVIVDVLARPGFREALTRGVRLGRDGWIGFVTMETDAGWRRPRLSLSVPTGWQPRPARLLVPPNDAASRALFAECRFTTADWLGF